MNVLQKGGVVVLLSTVVASVLILQINNSAIGENKVDPKALTDMESSRTKETALSSKSSVNTSNDALTTILDKNKLASSVDTELKNSSVSEHDGVALLPPPGPFIKSNTTSSIGMNIIKADAPSAPVSPIPPIQDPVAKNATTLNTKSLEETASRIIEPSKPKTLISPSIKREMPAEPQVVKSIANNRVVGSRNIEAPKAQTMPNFKGVITTPSAPTQKNNTPSQTANHNRSPQPPIWMQKAPNLTALRSQPQKFDGRQINNQRPNFPTQRYMVVPTPMYAPNFSYPQANMYGGAYYYAPTQPQYNNMMPPMMGQPNKLTQPEKSPNKGSIK